MQVPRLCLSGKVCEWCTDERGYLWEEGVCVCQVYSVTNNAVSGE